MFHLNFMSEILSLAGLLSFIHKPIKKHTVRSEPFDLYVVVMPGFKWGSKQPEPEPH